MTYHPVQHTSSTQSSMTLSKSTISMYSCNPAQSYAAGESAHCHNHGLPVHHWVNSVSVPNRISDFPRSWLQSASLNSLDHSLPVDLPSCSITASKCIWEFTKCQPPTASLSSLDYRIEACCPWVTPGVCWDSGKGGGLSDGEYIFGRPRGRWTSSHYYLIWLHTILWNLMARRYRMFSLHSSAPCARINLF